MKRKVSSLVLCCLLLFSLSTMCSASQYQITSQELDLLDQNLIQLSNLNSQLSTDLTKSKQELIVVRTELVKYQQDLLQTQTELVQLINESKLAKQDLLQAQNSLQVANESLTKLDKEVKSEIRSLRLQRDLSFVALAYLFIKK